MPILILSGIFLIFSVYYYGCKPYIALAWRWRRGRDSNPRWSLPTPVFKTGALNHYATSPGLVVVAYIIPFSEHITKTAVSLELGRFMFN